MPKRSEFRRVVGGCSGSECRVNMEMKAYILAEMPHLPEQEGGRWRVLTVS
jgi:hypothetical protein